jgi:hypothetical protein
MSSVYHRASHHSSRRPTALKDTDYDHEIYLIDHTKRTSRARSPSQSARGSRPSSLEPPEEEHEPRPSNEQLRKKLSIREELARRRYSKPKYQDRRLGDDLNDEHGQEGIRASSDAAPSAVNAANEDSQTGESSHQQEGWNQTPAERDSVIDVLYENQRGGFLCGMPLFSSKALGFLDAPPWTNIAQKASATNITNAQVPDPSWQWAWKEWTINHTDEVDEDGWEYSFMFSKKCSWHGPSWYNSFVRRRAWIRKRVKKKGGYQMEEAHRLNSEYFSIHAHPTRSRSRSPGAPSIQESRYSVGQLARRNMEAEVDREDIRDIGALMKALKLSRIDREKMEVVENFIQNGGDDLFHLKEYMDEIMQQFIFQASRKLLLAHLSQILADLSNQKDGTADDDKEEDSARQRRLEYLEAAITAADEQVKRLEFWSDIKNLVERGETSGGVDDSQGWNEEKWTGIDDSGPKDVISDRELPGGGPEANGPNGPEASGSGKGKEKA